MGDINLRLPPSIPLSNSIPYFTYMVTEAYFHQRPCPFIRKNTQIDNLHVEEFQECHILESKTTTPSLSHAVA